MVEDAMVAILRQKTGAERLAIAHRLFASASQMLRRHLRHQHPEWPEDAIEREAARRLSHGAV